MRRIVPAEALGIVALLVAAWLLAYQSPAQGSVRTNWSYEVLASAPTPASYFFEAIDKRNGNLLFAMARVDCLAETLGNYVGGPNASIEEPGFSYVHRHWSGDNIQDWQGLLYLDLQIEAKDAASYHCAPATPLVHRARAVQSEMGSFAASSFPGAYRPSQFVEVEVITIGDPFDVRVWIGIFGGLRPGCASLGVNGDSVADADSYLGDDVSRTVAMCIEIRYMGSIGGPKVSGPIE